MSDDELDQLLKELQGEDLDSQEYDFLTDEEVDGLEGIAELYCEAEQCDDVDCLLCEIKP